MRPRTNLAIALIAAAILAIVAVKSFTQQAPRLASKPTPEKCTPEAIRLVNDALERSVLSAKCAEQARAGTHLDAMPASR